MSGSTERRQGRRMREVAAQFGGTENVTTDAPRYDWRDPYHALLAIGWGPFLLGVFAYYTPTLRKPEKIPCQFVLQRF